MITKKIAVHTLDASGQILGRLATEIATKLRGKNKLGFTYNQDHGDGVIVLNCDRVVLTGRKEFQKKYYRHSTYPGNLKTIPYKKMLEQHPEQIIYLAVRTMLPDNKLRPIWLKRLKINTSTDGDKE